MIKSHTLILYHIWTTFVNQHKWNMTAQLTKKTSNYKSGFELFKEDPKKYYGCTNDLYCS